MRPVRQLTIDLPAEGGPVNQGYELDGTRAFIPPSRLPRFLYHDQHLVQDDQRRVCRS